MAQRMRVRVTVHLKKGVVDSTGANTAKTLALLGLTKVRDVHTATLYELEVDAQNEQEAKALATEACARLLANPVIHRTSVEVVPLGRAT